MKKYIYSLFALLILGSCTKSEIENTEDITTSSVIVLDNGELQFKLNASIATMDEYNIITRSEYATMETTIEDGWLFVFSEDTSADAASIDGIKYGDGSELVQKIAFSVDSYGDINITSLHEYNAPCFIRILANVTDKTELEIASLVASADGEDGKTASTFADYKYISVSLIGYYNITYDELFGGTTIPDPSSLRTKKGGFPAASPGIAMPNGVTASTINDINTGLTLVPVGSKVTVETTCDFELQEVYALNVAKRAMMRSTVLDNDGTSTIDDMPVPTNFGGTTKTAAVTAINGTTVDSPIYIFPNEGDDPYSESNGFSGKVDMLGIQIEDESLYPISDVPNSKNPTYIIVKGRAKGYSVDGYYKIALINSSNGYTYDVLRNGHYKVNIYDVDNAGYATADEAEAGPSSEISYDITIGVSSDSRNIIKVSNNGLFSVEIDANEIFAQGFGTDGVTADFMVKLVDNDTENTYFTSSSKATLSATDGITLITTEVAADGEEYKVQFTATQSGTITLRCGDLIQEVKVNYVDLLYSYQSGQLVYSDGYSVFTESLSIEDFDNSISESSTNTSAMLSTSGVVAANNSYENRICSAKIYRAGGAGITKLYLRQASNFGLFENGVEYACEIGESATARTIVYQSTGNIYSINGVKRGDTTIDISDIMSYEIKGDINSTWTEDCFISGINGEFLKEGWGNSKTFTFQAIDIKENQTSTSSSTSNYYSSYDYSRYHLTNIDNPATVTISNEAGETKTYTFYVEQYALPFNSHGSGTCNGGVADMYGSLLATYNNTGDYTHTCAFYNCSSTTSSNTFVWTDKGEDGDLDTKVFTIDEYTSQRKSGAYVFRVQVRNDTALRGLPNEQDGYYQMTLYNDAGESATKNLYLVEYSRDLLGNYGVSYNTYY